MVEKVGGRVGCEAAAGAFQGSMVYFVPLCFSALFFYNDEIKINWLVTEDFD